MLKSNVKEREIYDFTVECMSHAADWSNFDGFMSACDHWDMWPNVNYTEHINIK